MTRMGYGEIVCGINFGSASFEPPQHGAHGHPSGGSGNSLAEMWIKSKHWLVERGGANGRTPDEQPTQRCK